MPKGPKIEKTQSRLNFFNPGPEFPTKNRVWRVARLKISISIENFNPRGRSSRAAKRGCFKRGCFPIWTCPSFFVLFCPFLSFLGLSRFFWDFPDLLGDSSGIFPICPFPLSRPIKSTYEEQSRKGPRHNLDLSRKKWETPGFGNTPV